MEYIEILLKIEKETLAQIEQEMYIKHLTDNIAGMLDAFVMMILNSITKGQKEVIVEKKR